MKEALNTFSEGLVKDYNEMAVPSKVMTNCLNGTLITYNGNEFTLQNDMGNAKLENVKLPAGYVPVGTAEYGGIVYIASYNPITKKGQIGSYPSPRLLWGTEYDGSTEGEESVTIVPTDFLEDGDVKTPIIKNEIVKKYLFRINGNSRHFSVGDLWNVFTESFPGWLALLLDNDYAKIEFSVINDSGHTETIDKLSYTNIGEDIYEAREGIQIIPSENSSGNPPKTKWLVLNTLSNGILLMTLRLNTYLTFVLNRRYNLDSNGNIESVTFTGKADNEDVELYYLGVGKSITIQPENGLVKYNIMPVHPAGVVKRLARSGTIDIAKLLELKSSFYNFHFYVGEYNTTIYWSYDYIDVNNDSITKMEVSYKQLKTTGESEAIKVTLLEDSYIGDFLLVLGSLKLGGIYKIVFTIYKKDLEGNEKGTDIVTKYLYNVPLFNNWSAKDFEDCKERPTISITPTYTTKTKVTSASVTVKRNSGWVPNADLVNIKNPQLSDYIVRKPLIEHDFLTVKEGSYTIEPSIDLLVQEIEFEDLIYKTTQLGAEFLGLTYSILNNVEIVETPTYSSLINNDKLKEDSSATVEGNTINVTTHRSIYAPLNTPYEKTLYTESLMPVYDQDHDKLFSFKESDGTLSNIAAGRIRVMHHSAVVKYGNTTNVSDGINTNLGGDEEGLLAAMSAMGDQSFGIMAGYGGRKASLRIGNYLRPYGVLHNDSFSDSSHVWWNDKSETEIDENDNFLIATCKDTNGLHFLLNLATRKNESIHSRKELPYYLRAILSQLLIAKRTKVTEPITAPDLSKVTYHTDYNTDVKINYSVNSGFTMKTGDGDDYNQILESLGDKALYIPNYVISTNNILEETITVGKELGIEDSPNLLTYYSISLSSVTISQESYKTLIEEMNKEPENYKYSSNDTIDANHLRSYIFIGEVNSIDVNTGVCELATYNDGNYVVKGIAGTENGLIWQNSYSPTKLTYWDSCNNTTALKRDINVGNLNRLFTTSLKFEGKLGVSIGEDYYNTLLLNAVSGANNGRAVCKWVEDSPDVNAPDMIMGYFGLLSPFKYNL